MPGLRKVHLPSFVHLAKRRLFFKGFEESTDNFSPSDGDNDAYREAESLGAMGRMMSPSRSFQPACRSPSFMGRWGGIMALPEPFIHGAMGRHHEAHARASVPPTPGRGARSEDEAWHAQPILGDTEPVTLPAFSEISMCKSRIT